MMTGARRDAAETHGATSPAHALPGRADDVATRENGNQLLNGGWLANKLGRAATRGGRRSKVNPFIRASSLGDGSACSLAGAKTVPSSRPSGILHQSAREKKEQKNFLPGSLVRSKRTVHPISYCIPTYKKIPHELDIYICLCYFILLRIHLLAQVPRGTWGPKPHFYKVGPCSTWNRSFPFRPG